MPSIEESGQHGGVATNSHKDLSRLSKRRTAIASALFRSCRPDLRSALLPLLQPLPPRPLVGAAAATAAVEARSGALPLLNHALVGGV